MIASCLRSLLRRTRQIALPFSIIFMVGAASGLVIFSVLTYVQRNDRFNEIVLEDRHEIVRMQNAIIVNQAYVIERQRHEVAQCKK